MKKADFVTVLLIWEFVLPIEENPFEKGLFLKLLS